MKRFISLITAVTLLLTLVLCNTSTVSAAKEQLEFVLTNAAGLNNEEITIELQLKNNPGIYAYYMMIYYDTDVFILRDYELTDEFAKIGSLSASNPNQTAKDFEHTIGLRVVESFPSYGVDPEGKSMILLMYEIDDISENCTLNGASIKFTFQIMGIAEAGDYTIGIVPDAESMINIDANEVPFKMTNSIVKVGSTEVPAETAPSQSHNDTQKVETTETTANDIVILDTTTENETPVITAPEETFKGDDGKVYYENEAGETVEYKEEDFTVNSDSASGNDSTVPDINVGNDGEDEGENENKKNSTILYIVIAAVLVLAGVAGILIVFISKTKKSEDAEENSASNDENND